MFEQRPRSGRAIKGFDLDDGDERELDEQQSIGNTSETITRCALSGQQQSRCLCSRAVLCCAIQCNAHLPRHGQCTCGDGATDCVMLHPMPVVTSPHKHRERAGAREDNPMVALDCSVRAGHYERMRGGRHTMDAFGSTRLIGCKRALRVKALAGDVRQRAKGGLPHTNGKGPRAHIDQARHEQQHSVKTMSRTNRPYTARMFISNIESFFLPTTSANRNNAHKNSPSLVADGISSRAVASRSPQGCSSPRRLQASLNTPLQLGDEPRRPQESKLARLVTRATVDHLGSGLCWPLHSRAQVPPQ